ncbi:MAG: methyltransferase domain-containing protein [Gemmatimonadales bacterium]|nr:MAG: methyltransferase domain-containing protein [Gemmatimonadales bacterium]
MTPSFASTQATTPSCPLCGGPPPVPLVEAHGRRYLECRDCGLALVAPGDLPTAGEERARYDTHRNDPGDPGYRAFLARLADPLQEVLAPGARGLDYGSGPGPTLSVMMAERGFSMEIWDPFYAPDPAPLARTWDFVTCTETAEHFHCPGAEFDRLGRLLGPGGTLALMTSWWSPPPGATREERARHLARWHYIRDPTHVALYRRSTLDRVARDRGWDVRHPRRNVSLFRIPG